MSFSAPAHTSPRGTARQIHVIFLYQGDNRMPKIHLIDKELRDVGFDMDMSYTVKISEFCIFHMRGNEGMIIIQVWRRVMLRFLS
jgi:hypothetical protein